MYKIQHADPADSAQIVDVLRRSIAEVCAVHYHDPAVIEDWLRNKTVDNISAWIRADNSYAVVCTDHQDTIVGFALTTFSGEIRLLYLVPEALHQGNGKLMLDKLERFLCRQGLSEVHTTSSITARAFYLRNGFVENGEPQLVGNILGDFPLIKPLSPD